MVFPFYMRRLKNVAFIRIRGTATRGRRGRTLIGTERGLASSSSDTLTPGERERERENTALESAFPSLVH